MAGGTDVADFLLNRRPHAPSGASCRVSWSKLSRELRSTRAPVHSEMDRSA